MNSIDRIIIEVMLCLVVVKCQNIDPELKLTVEELVKKHGYPFEVFSDIETEDGYLLDVYRIPHGRNNTNTVRRPAVLLMHGLTGNSRNYVAMGPKHGLAFILADHGYDVWLANCRGSSPSRKHRTLDADVNEEYWEFSWHEIGYYDTPANFDLILNVTKLERISFIAHSQGTTTHFVFASTRPEYNKNITVGILLGPQAYMTHIYSPFLRSTAVWEPMLALLLQNLGIKQLPPKRIAGLFLGTVQVFCTLEMLQDVCAHFFYGVGGFSPKQFQKNYLPRITVGFPSVAVRQMSHYAQNINSGKFRQFDFGREGNLKKYGMVEPPSYNLSQITSPLALYYSPGDWLVDVRDVRRECHEVKNCAYVYKVKNKRFNHYDFVLAKDVVSLVYNDVVKTLDKFNSDCKTTKAC